MSHSFHNLSKSASNTSYHFTTSQLNYEQKHQTNSNHLDLLLNNTSNNYSNLFTNDTQMVHDSEVLLNESLLDELFKSPIKNHQHDPLISNTYNDNLMDSLNS